MSDDPKRGLYGKYEVRRADGSSGPGGRHEHCAYYVLDLEHDEFAIPALKAYAKAARNAYPELANDLDRIIEASRRKEATRCNCREVGCPHSLGQAMTLGASDTAHEIINQARSKR